MLGLRMLLKPFEPCRKEENSIRGSKSAIWDHDVHLGIVQMRKASIGKRPDRSDLRSATCDPELYMINN